MPPSWVMYGSISTSVPRRGHPVYHELGRVPREGSAFSLLALDHLILRVPHTLRTVQRASSDDPAPANLFSWVSFRLNHKHNDVVIPTGVERFLRNEVEG